MVAFSHTLTEENMDIKNIEKDSSAMIAAMMFTAARTAPKTRGIDNIETVIIDDEPVKKKLLKKMSDISKAEDRPSFERDANSISQTKTIVVIGARSNPAGLNCGCCGCKTCEELAQKGGVCAYNSIDLGIAASSAAGIANTLHADNRLMYSIGRASIDLGLFSDTVHQALGIPLSITGKSPFFDRK